MGQIVFKKGEWDTGSLTYRAEKDGITVGFARIAGEEDQGELRGVWLTEEGRSVCSQSELDEALFDFLRSLGYRSLYMESEYIEDGDSMGFTLEDRDTSGWYPKYKFSKKL